MDWATVIIAVLGSTVLSAIVNGILMRPKILAEASEIGARTVLLKRQDEAARRTERREHIEMQLTEEEVVNAQLNRLFQVVQRNMESGNAIILSLESQIKSRDRVVDELRGQLEYREKEAEVLHATVSDLKQEAEFQARFSRERIETLERLLAIERAENENLRALLERAKKIISDWRACITELKQQVPNLPNCENIPDL